LRAVSENSAGSGGAGGSTACAHACAAGQAASASTAQKWRGRKRDKVGGQDGL
jgi:hypothetical protein